MNFLRGLARTILKPVIWVKEHIVDEIIDQAKGAIS